MATKPHRVISDDLPYRIFFLAVFCTSSRIRLRFLSTPLLCASVLIQRALLQCNGSWITWRGVQLFLHYIIPECFCCAVAYYIVCGSSMPYAHWVQHDGTLQVSQEAINVVKAPAVRNPQMDSEI